ncbi:MAG: IS1182 family transposase [Candidatus Bathyarchaeia archaeon]
MMKMDNLFKPYNQNQLMLLPPSLEELIPEGHLARVVNQVIEELDLSELIETYKGGGASAYHPVMMLKVLIWGYLDGIRTSRRLAKALRENVVYMWLAGGQKPDFRTIANFRSGRLRGCIKRIFKRVVEIANMLGLVDFSRLFVDGSKFEANGNRHKMVWRKRIEMEKEKLERKIEEILEEAERLEEEENRRYGDKDLPEVGEGRCIKDEDVQRVIKEETEKENEKIRARKKKALERKLRELKERKMRYEGWEERLRGRKGCSRTDPDASCMRMKDDVLKPAYNVLLGTENQVIVNYEVEQNASDGSCFINLMDGIKDLYGRVVEKVSGDAAFGNEENYAYCEKNGIEAYLKYPTYHAEKTRKFKEDVFRKENWEYDERRDVYVCPRGEELEFCEEAEEVTATGYRKKVKIYRCKGCNECPHKGICTKGESRSVSRNERNERFKATARQLLNSPIGEKLRKERGSDVEATFGDIKNNLFFRRFLLRGKLKVEVEMGLIAIAHNIKKIREKIREFKDWICGNGGRLVHAIA